MLAKISSIKKKNEQVKSIHDIFYSIDELKEVLKMIEKPESKKDSKNEFYKELVNKELLKCYTSLSTYSKGQESINYLKEALKYKKDFGVYNNLAYLYLTEYNDYKQSIEYYNQCLSIDLTKNMVYHGLIQIYKQIGSRENELKYIDMGLKYCPEDGEFYNFKGVYTFEEGNCSQSIEILKEGISKTKDPKVSSKMYMNIAHILSCIGLQDDSISYYEKSLNVDPEHILSYENILLHINYFKQIPLCLIDHKYKRYSKTIQIPKSIRDNNVYTCMPDYHKFICNILYEQEHANAKKAAAQSNQQINQTTTISQKTFMKLVNSRNLKRDSTLNNHRIRIGYVSGDLVGHAVSFFTGCLFKEYNTDKFDIFIYSTKFYEQNAIDSIGKGLKYRHIQNCTVDTCVSMLADDNIDILIDLSGFTSGNKLVLFGAISLIENFPIQIISYLGYPANNGIKNMYRITDDYTEQACNESNALIKMPRLFLCYCPIIQRNMEIRKKHIQGYENHIVLGSFAKLQKINFSVIALWTRILDTFKERGIPCILLLKCKFFSDAKTKELWQSKFGSRDDVLLLNGTNEHCEHLECFNLLDLQLDTWPYSGTTITNESLFMNVPVITYYDSQSNHVSRVSASILNAMTRESVDNFDCNIFNDFICKSEEEYIEKVFKYYMIGRNRQLPIHHTFIKCMDQKRFMNEYENVLENFLKDK
jgi:predicted O-linked N-acetylglucosamine transferase (SPINDLY family)